MRAIHLVTLAATVNLLVGCSTPYQEMGFSGGVTAQPITRDTYRIVSRGNSYTSTTAVQDYVLLKAAETTKQAGGTHFALISARDASRVSYETFYDRGFASTDTEIKPGEDAHIRVLKLSPGTSAPTGAYNADEIIQFVGSRVKRSN
jgi:hypothetical protein